MASSHKGTGIAPFTPLETAQLLLDEWKFRQAHCWRLLARFGLAAILVSVAPYASASLIPAWGPYLTHIAWFGFGLELIVAWLFAAEYIRCQRKGQAYEKLLETYWPGVPPMIESWKSYEIFFGFRIGWFVFFAILIVSTAILIANLFVLEGWPFAAT